MKSSSHRSCGSRKKAPDSEGPMRRPQASFEAQPRSARLLAPRWASAPTNIHEKSTDLEGGQSRPPLQRSMKNHAGQAKNHRVFHFMPGRADVGIGPYNRPHKAPDLEGGQSRPPIQRGLKTRRVRRKLLRLPFCVVGVDAHIDPFRRQNGNTPVGGRKGVIVQGFDFAP